MKKTKFSHKVISVFLITFALLMSYKMSAQGPNAPEAASFEPVDVTDMVNLVTGDFTYTIPAINVPGPNGGYPLALSYHAGIAMDQEASWVGLGWSLNPGAINRSVNGYPDDWDNVKTYDYYWNKGQTLIQHTIDISFPIKGISIGVGASWGSLRGFSGSVGLGPVTFGSDGIGASIGITDHASLSIGANLQSGFNIGAGFNSGGQFGGKLGIGYSEGGGFSGSASVYGRTNKNVGDNGVNGSLGITTNGAITYGLGASLKDDRSNSETKGKTIRAGSGGSYFSTTLQQDDITIKQSGFSVPLLFVNYRYEKVKVFVDKLKKPGVSGAVFSDNILLNVPQSIIDFCEEKYGKCDPRGNNFRACNCIRTGGVNDGYTGTTTNPDYAFADISEIHRTNRNGRFSILRANPVMLNYDGFHVSGQGMSGHMSPKIMKNIALANVNHDFEEAELTYYRPESPSLDNVPAAFYLDNELVSGALINKVNFNDVTNPSNFGDYIGNPSTAIAGEKRAGSYIEYFTFDNIPSDVIVPENFAQPNYVKSNSIAGYRITSSDGITYTYMLPVYSVMEKFRTFNYRDIERDVYAEKTNQAYATHWLLTSITGPDYVDINTNGKLDEEDYGYWVNFEYGKWSEGMVWRTPGKMDELSRMGGTRRYNWGFKELYYLDKINTRTHTALFIKELREDHQGVPQKFIYKDPAYDKIMPVQKQLRLKKILLIKNSNLGIINKDNSDNIADNPNLEFSFYEPKLNKTYNLKLNLQNNVIDSKDGFIVNLEQKALNVVGFDYDYSLAKNAPNSNALGKLTLKKLFFRGKKGVSLMPPYHFNYNNNPDWDYDNENYWGYNHLDATAWSLNGIMTPQGAKIGIDYEGDSYSTFGDYPNKYRFRNVEADPKPDALDISGDIGNYELADGDIIDLQYEARIADCDQLKAMIAKYSGKVLLEKQRAIPYDVNTYYTFKILEPEKYSYEIDFAFSNEENCGDFSRIENIEFLGDKKKNHAGIRVANINVSDGINTLKTTYEYERGSVPYESFYDSEGVENQNLLRSPNVLYDKVIVKNLDHNNTVINDVKTVYEFITDLNLIQHGYRKLEIEFSDQSLNSFNNRPTYGQTFEYKDYQNLIGNLKKKSTYQGDVLLFKNVNNYAFLEESSGLVNTESTQMYKSVNPRPGVDNFNGYNYLISTSYTKYPVILKSSETVQGGFKTIAYTSDHRDINSGQLLETTLTASDGKEYKTEIIPAYSINEYAVMGSKMDNLSNKNMLTQQAMSKSYIKENGEWVLTGSEIETWKPQNYIDQSSNNSSIWRKHKNFIWDGQTDNEGLFTSYTGNDDNFNWAIGVSQSSDSEWKQISEVSKYDKYSMPLEVIDINGNKIATKMGNQASKVIATGNAGHTELFYSGAEYVLNSNSNYFDGEIGAAGRSTDKAHTGMYSVKTTPGLQGFKTELKAGEHKTGRYKISVWADKANHANARIYDGNQVQSFNGEIITAGDWVQLNHYTDIPNTTIEIYVSSTSGTVYFDDFRLCPISSSMSSYVYNEWDELWYILGANNLATRFEYDASGRLIKTYQEVIDQGSMTGGFKKTSENAYNYQRGIH